MSKALFVALSFLTITINGLLFPLNEYSYEYNLYNYHRSLLTSDINEVSTSGWKPRYQGIHKSDWRILNRRALYNGKNSGANDGFLGASNIGPFRDIDSKRIAYRFLPKTLIPIKYIVSIDPDYENLSFNGTVNVLLKSVDDTSRIVFNAHNLTIKGASVKNVKTAAVISVNEYNYYEADQCGEYYTNDTLTAGSYFELAIRYTGYISKDSWEGLSLAEFKDQPKNQILMSDSEPTYARKVFPCWDEPNFKANFVIRIARRPEEIALSNMPVNYSREDHVNGKVWDTFVESPKMSTYLVAIVVGDLSVVQDTGHKIWIWMQRGKEEKAKFALNFSSAVVDKLGKYFGLEYTSVMPKLDQVAIPKLKLSAMENWGLITYSEKWLLLEDKDTTENKINIGYRIAHEIAHQWLGNLVTVNFWNVIWLSEGFTHFFHHLITDWIKPEWRAMETFVVTECYVLLNHDQAYLNSQPLATLNDSAITSNDVLSVFNLISYFKGGFIARMLYHIVTPEVFRLAMRNYIKENKYKNVVNENLLDCFSQKHFHKLNSLPADVKEIMHNWIYLSNYPILHVQRIAVAGSNNTLYSILLKQEVCRGQLSETIFHNRPTTSSNHRWWIPLTYTTSNDVNFEDTKPKQWFNITAEEYILKNVFLQDKEWIIFNIQHTGYFIVNYDLVMWQLITKFMVDNSGFDKIHPLNRAALIRDANQLAASKAIDIQVFLNLTLFLRRETDLIVWTGAIDCFDILQLYTRDFAANTLLNKYVQWLLSNWFEKIKSDYKGLNLETLYFKSNSNTAWSWACKYDLKVCIDIALEQVYLMMSGADLKVNNIVKMDLLCKAVAYGQNEVWQWVRKKYIESVVNYDKNSLMYLNAMACTRDPITLKEMLSEIFSQSLYLSKFDRIALLYAIVDNVPFTKNVKFIIDNFIENYSDHFELYISTQIIDHVKKLYLHNFDLVMELKEQWAGTNVSSIFFEGIDIQHIKTINKELKPVRDWLKRQVARFEKIPMTTEQKYKNEETSIISRNLTEYVMPTEHVKHSLKVLKDKENLFPENEVNHNFSKELVNLPDKSFENSKNNNLELKVSKKISNASISITKTNLYFITINIIIVCLIF